MQQISGNAINLDIERIIEIKNKVLQIKPIYLKSIVGYSTDKYTQYLTSSKIEKGYSFYKKTFKEELSKDEKTILALYLIISDDNDLIKECLYKKGILKFVGRTYGVTEYFILLRLKVLAKIKNYEKEKKVLKYIKNKEVN